jgi:hypothetical protein
VFQQRTKYVSREPSTRYVGQVPKAPVQAIAGWQNIEHDSGTNRRTREDWFCLGSTEELGYMYEDT